MECTGVFEKFSQTQAIYFNSSHTLCEALYLSWFYQTSPIKNILRRSAAFVVVPKFHDQSLDCEVTFFARQQKVVPPLFQTMPYRPDVPDGLINNGRTPSTGKGSVYQTRGLGYMRRKWWRLKWVVLKCYTLYAICLSTVTLPISLYKLSNDRLLHYSTTFFCSDLKFYIFLLLLSPW